MRCLALAETLRRQGADVRFVCREQDGHLCEVIESRGIPVSRLVRAGDHGPREGNGWLGTSWERDAAETASFLSGQAVDWLVVDHYGIDARWEQKLASRVKRIMVIDDLADRPHLCDVLLDQNLVAHLHTRYAGRVPERCRMLLGPQFALLQPEYVTARSRATPRTGALRRIVVAFGGADAPDLTGRALRAVLSLGRADVTVDVVVSTAGRLSAIKGLAAGHHQVRVHDRLPTLAPLMVDSQLAIGGSGSTTWERLCLGLPALVVTLADNQRPAAAELQRRGLLRWVGHHDEVDEAELASAIAREIERGADEECSRRALATVDGRGAERVTAAMSAFEELALRARPVTPADEELLLVWANDPETRRNAFTQTAITPEGHHAWLKARLARPERCRFFMIESTLGEPVGQVRFDHENGGWNVSYSIARAFRGRGLGRGVLEAALQALSRTTGPSETVVGLVKRDNEPSNRVFQGLGFTARAEETDRGVIVYTRGVHAAISASRS